LGSIRDNRTKLGLDQKSLAEKVGVSRQWIVEIEKRKSRASIGLLLPTIGALGIALAEKENPGKPKDTSVSHGVDAHVDNGFHRCLRKQEKKMREELVAFLDGRETGRVVQDHRAPLRRLLDRLEADFPGKPQHSALASLRYRVSRSSPCPML
jgi:transcriptional regulator with XRE-family HTH domain